MDSVRALLVACCCLLGPAFAHAAAPPARFPKGSEKAVAAVRAAFPKAKVESATEPRGFGGSGGRGTPMFWVVRYRADEQAKELSVTPEGAIIHLATAVAVKDLPRAVADAVAKAAPGEKFEGAEKHEMRATLKYVALDKPQAQRYAIDVSKDGKATRYVVSPDGKNIKATAIAAEKKADAPKKELDIPEKAAKAVKAIKALYPKGVVKQITHEVFDDGTGEIEILTYEIEFVTGGVEREMVASPEGVIPHLWAAVEAKDLPKAVTDAVEKEAPKAKVEKARAFEIRASLRFGAREKAKSYYTVRVAKDGKERTLKLKPDGGVIKQFEFPKK